jgi:hypothetical protein
LVAQGYTQVEGLDFGKTYASIARSEAIRILLAYACAHNIKLYQMDVKSIFLNGYISEEVYVTQPLGFEDDKKPNHAYKLKKALYGLKQAPRAWYERLMDFLLSKGFMMGKVETTLFTKKIGKDLFVLQIYVDDIILGSTNQDFYEEFGKLMANEFEMSMIGELSYFLGLCWHFLASLLRTGLGPIPGNSARNACFLTSSLELVYPSNAVQKYQVVFCNIYRISPQVHGNTVVAFHPVVFRVS